MSSFLAAFLKLIGDKACVAKLVRLGLPEFASFR